MWSPSRLTPYNSSYRKVFVSGFNYSNVNKIIISYLQRYTAKKINCCRHILQQKKRKKNEQSKTKQSKTIKK